MSGRLRGVIAVLTGALLVAGAQPVDAAVVEGGATAVATPTQQLTGTVRPVPVKGDFDGDGRDDIFWYVAGTGTDTLWSGKGRPSATATLDADRFTAQTLNISGTYQPAVGDFDGDGRDDIFWYGKGSLPDNVWYFTGRGTVQSKSVSISGDYKLHVGNFNKATTSADADDIFLYGPGYSNLWSGTTARTFASTSYPSPPPSGAQVFVGNWRQSSMAAGAAVHEDLLFYRPGTKSDVIWVGNGTSTFTTSAVTINGTYAPIVGTFDDTSGPDTTDIFWYAPGTTKDYVWMNTGSGFTSTPQTVNGKNYKPVVLTATDGGQSDILWNDPTGTDFIWKMTGTNGSFSHQSRTLAQMNSTATDPGTRTPLVADVNTSDPVAGGNSAGMTAAGHDHTCGVTSTGAARCWGSNQYGQLGHGLAVTGSELPVQVSGLSSGVTAIVSGRAHSCALTTAGGVKCWGDNIYSQLGNSNTGVSSMVPVDVTGLTSGVVSISAGRDHTCVITSTGAARCWGDNNYGQLGNGTGISSNVPVDVTGRTTGTATISAGGEHTCAVTTTGAAQCWGRNPFGQLGNGTTTSSNVPVNVTGRSTGTTSIDAGWDHTCVITSTGAAQCWGRNNYGQLGNGTSTNSNVPVNVTGRSTSTASISAGWGTTCAITAIGAAQCWGDNLYGTLGNGTTANSNVPVNVTGLSSQTSAISLGTAHACAITSAGATQCWGYGGGSQLGVPGIDTFVTVPVTIVSSDTWGSVASAGNPANVDLLWWSPGNGAGQNEILWTELESIE